MRVRVCIEELHSISHKFEVAHVRAVCGLCCVVCVYVCSTCTLCASAKLLCVLGDVACVCVTPCACALFDFSEFVSRSPVGQ